ncbi:glycoside hydrolase family 15 [Butyricimonas hominis]|uniref:glycoside hydrolase family 15 n=1 Tax=Butyricimonas TaxID=574697 RepID=UPI0035169FF7
MAKETLYDIWARRNPKFEVHFKESLLRQFADYGVGASELTSAKGKVFGAGYELYIYAFFLGLYSGEKGKRPLVGETDVLGQPIQFWGNVDSKKFRKAYPKIREYIFTAVVAKTDVDLIALERGDITERKVVDLLIDTMEQYTNFGFYLMKEKLETNPSYFYKNTGFLDMLLDLLVTLPNTREIEVEEL